MTSVKRKVAFRTSRQRAQVSSQEQKPSVERLPRVARLMALAIHFDEMLRDGRVHDQSELARLVHVTQPRMTQIMNLLHLAPDIQEEILHLPEIESGTETVTERELRPVAALTDWKQQRNAWKRLRNPSG